MKKFTICMVSVLITIPLFANTYSLQEAISNGSAEICKKIDGNINTVVVVEVQSDSESLSDYIYSELNYNFVNNLKKTFVAERNEFTLSLIKKEFEYQNSGEVSDVTIQSVGNSLGADCVVLGKIEDSSSGWKFSLKAVQVETKKILCIYSCTISKNDIDVKYITKKKSEIKIRDEKVLKSKVNNAVLVNKEVQNRIVHQELIEIPMVRVEGGTYTMGDGFHSDIPQKTVSVSSFYIAITELTQKQWKIIFDDFNPSFFKGEDYPVDSVNWIQAIMFCNRLSEYYGRTPCYTINGDSDIGKGLENRELTSILCDFSANGYRLPTEAEWEYAARGGKFDLKYKFSGSDNVSDVCWYFGNSKNTTHPVASKVSNDLGIYDMSGNVSEWCWDENLYLKRDRGGSYGSYLNWKSSLYVDCRDGEGVNPYCIYKGRGFRLVRTAN